MIYIDMSYYDNDDKNIETRIKITDTGSYKTFMAEYVNVDTQNFISVSYLDSDDAEQWEKDFIEALYQSNRLEADDILDYLALYNRVDELAHSTNLTDALKLIVMLHEGDEPRDLVDISLRNFELYDDDNVIRVELGEHGPLVLIDRL